MRISDLRLNYSAGTGIEPRTMHVQSPKVNTHCVKPPGIGLSPTVLTNEKELSHSVVTTRSMSVITISQ